MITIEKFEEECDRAVKFYAGEVNKMARALAKALGLEVNEKTGEIYNPAEGAYRSPAPRTSSWQAPQAKRMRFR